jgi:hypothetical protein
MAPRLGARRGLAEWSLANFSSETVLAQLFRSSGVLEQNSIDLKGVKLASAVAVHGLTDAGNKPSFRESHSKVGRCLTMSR